MRCHRCHGPMVHQKFYGAEVSYWGWRCLPCGEIVDPIILENRDVSLKAVDARNAWEKTQRPRRRYCQY
jgi:hypothetical protein